MPSIQSESAAPWLRVLRPSKSSSVNHNWFSGNDQFFYTQKPFEFVAFAEVYTALVCRPNQS